uniref:Integrase p58-like C-terminal domain-containing protein n=1 Tax=Pygocentrus nattereri TaxID=42514 RepID=A0AAR2K808_PYGNA
MNVLDYVSSFRERWHRACILAKDMLCKSQTKMKRSYDKKTVVREFTVGDKVLVLLPVPGSTMSSRFTGPYVIKEKLSEVDYVVSTPDRRRKSRVCHINMLKPYYERETSPGKGIDPEASGTLVYAVHQLLDSRRHEGVLQYIEDWYGYGLEEQSCVCDVLDLGFHSSPCPGCSGWQIFATVVLGFYPLVPLVAWVVVILAPSWPLWGLLSHHPLTL